MLQKTWLPFWIGDMAGVMVMAPFFVALLSKLVPGVLLRLNRFICIANRSKLAHIFG